MNITIEIPERLAPIIEGFLKAYTMACLKHPEFVSNELEMCAVLNEECGEVSKAVMEQLHGSGSIDNVKDELNDVAAVCMRGLMMINKHIDRNEFKFCSFCLSTTEGQEFCSAECQKNYNNVYPF